MLIQKFNVSTAAATAAAWVVFAAVSTVAVGAVPAEMTQRHGSTIRARYAGDAVQSTPIEAVMDPQQSAQVDAVKLTAAIALVLLGGLLAGLTLGLMSLDETNLQILLASGTPQQKRHAARILPIRRTGHLLLVVLLLANTLVNETLPILFDSIMGGHGGGLSAVLASTALVVIFGEILPQAICARHGLAVGAFFAWPVRALVWLLYPIAAPIAWLLDTLLGASHGTLYRRHELRELVTLLDEQHGGSLTRDEATIVRGALGLAERPARMAMTALEDVQMLDADAVLDHAALVRIVDAGHSRLPVHAPGRRDRIVGVLLVKTLILVNPAETARVRDLPLLRIPRIPAGMSMFDLLNIFQEGGSHMAVVVDDDQCVSGVTGSDTDSDDSTEVVPDEATALLRASIELDNAPPVGIITLEDIIEELIQEEIVDETDVFVDIHQRLRVPRPHQLLSTLLAARSTNSMAVSGTIIGDNTRAATAEAVATLAAAAAAAAAVSAVQSVAPDAQTHSSTPIAPSIVITSSSPKPQLHRTNSTQPRLHHPSRQPSTQLIQNQLHHQQHQHTSEAPTPIPEPASADDISAYDATQNGQGDSSNLSVVPLSINNDTSAPTVSPFGRKRLASSSSLTNRLSDYQGSVSARKKREFVDISSAVSVPSSPHLHSTKSSDSLN